MDHVEFAAYARLRRGALVQHAYVLTGDPFSAEDLVQATLLRLLSYRERLDADRNVDAYVRRVMVRLHATWWRRPSARELPDHDLPERPGPDGTDALVDRAMLRSALSSLPARQRAAVVLRYVEDLSEQHAADALGCTVGTVKSQTARGLAKLRAALC